jgi:hypothetical protein
MQAAVSQSETESPALFPYSVIPGGAHSRAELERAIANDPVVARHYAGFDAGNARVVRLDHAESMYVSYRIGAQIYWTDKPLELRAGETLITDATNAARTRCGNRLSVTPATPVSARQPRPEAMEAAPDLSLYAMAAPQLFPLLPPTLLPRDWPVTPETPGALVPEAIIPNGVLPAPFPVPIFPIVGGVGPGTPPGPPIPIATPEPSTLALLFAGIAVIAVFYARKSRSHRRAN